MCHYQPSVTVMLDPLKEAGGSTVSCTWDKGDKFHDGGAATCSLPPSCDSFIDQSPAFSTLSCLGHMSAVNTCMALRDQDMLQDYITV